MNRSARDPGAPYQNQKRSTVGRFVNDFFQNPVSGIPHVRGDEPFC